MTVPQMMMLNHASWKNNKQSNKTTAQPDEEAVYRGKPLDKLNSEEMQAYYGSW